MNPWNIPRDMFLGIYRGTHSSEYSGGPVPRNFPRDPFLGIFRGLRSSEIPDENSEEHFVGTSEDWTIRNSIKISRGSSPAVYSEELSDELVVLGVSSEIYFLGIPSENSEGFPRKNEFPRTCFVGMSQTFVKSLEPFVNWLEEAEEEECRGTDQHGKHLCLASRLDAVVARLDTQAKMDTITKSMTNIVKSLESSLATDKMCLIVMLVLSVDLMQQVADDYGLEVSV
ncbi:hypothetical protein F2Q70_00043581 [Brassica cretica]|uniref:Uncharacterized protein n=1 Tax=Brassica cretica TaxID=69181 RepID=A0A8S9KGI7_BRACR|nr:hypothetical protein F2Q70_00043581 [Brassica cretica]